MLSAIVKRSTAFLALLLIIPITPVEANDDLDEIVEVRTEDTSQLEEANRMIDRLGRVGSSILKAVNDYGVEFIITDQALTDLPEFEHLKGLTPPGWEGTGLTWDDVPGAGADVSAARIGYSDSGQGHSSVNLELHEFAHTVDDYVSDIIISDTEEFNNIMTQEKDNLFYDHEVPEYFDVPSEYFAEAFALYYIGGLPSEMLQERAPLTYQFIETINSRILNVSEVTGDTVTLTWEDSANADYYVIYQDGEAIDSVTASEFTAENLNTETDYEFFIEAYDQNGNLIFTSYSEYAMTNIEVDEEENSENAEEEDITESVSEETDDSTDTVSEENESDVSDNHYDLVFNWSDTAETDSYGIYNGNDKVDEVSSSQGTYTLSNLDASQNYEIYVRAYDDNGDRLYTYYYQPEYNEEDTQFVNLSDLTQTLEEAGASQTSLTEYDAELSWNDIEDADTYIIYQNDVEVAQVDQGTETATLSDLSINENYAVTIEVLDEDGEVLYEKYHQFIYTDIEDDTQEIELNDLD